MINIVCPGQVVSVNTREHFDWSVARAVEYLDRGQAETAMASLTADLNNHPGTAGILTSGMQLLMLGEYTAAGVAGVRRFITGLPVPTAEASG